MPEICYTDAVRSKYQVWKIAYKMEARPGKDQSKSDEMVAKDSLGCGDWPLVVFHTIWTYKYFRQTI